MEEYVAVNRANWDDRAAAHAASADYNVAGYADPAHLSDVVRFDRPLLGGLSGIGRGLERFSALRGGRRRRSKNHAGADTEE